jgi:hypothetical protein
MAKKRFGENFNPRRRPKDSVEKRFHTDWHLEKGFREPVVRIGKYRGQHKFLQRSRGAEVVAEKRRITASKPKRDENGAD